jgi:hypothetical protein
VQAGDVPRLVAELKGVEWVEPGEVGARGDDA